MNKLIITLFALVITIAMYFICEPAAITKSHKVIVLSKDNTVSLNLPIMGDSAKDVQLDLMRKGSMLPRNSPIYLVLNSPGGSIYDGQKIIETAKGLSQPVHTISLFSASMSFIISQLLDTRYVLESSTLMSHRAYASGMDGQVPGNLVTRVKSLVDMALVYDTKVAERAGITTEQYQKDIADELWLYGEANVSRKYADETVRVKCDSSLQGTQAPKTFSLFGMNVTVVWHLCPLVQEPVSVVVSGANTNNPYIWAMVRGLLYDREGFIRRGGLHSLGGYK